MDAPDAAPVGRALSRRSMLTLLSGAIIAKLQGRRNPQPPPTAAPAHSPARAPYYVGRG
jgi:hypothetical protein